ncbi:MAG: hypothetical protein M3460_25230 [Actinomycetota bacterium]|nr:hypothetical protein [Actinomycetota bacterium]
MPKLLTDWSLGGVRVGSQTISSTAAATGITPVTIAVMSTRARVVPHGVGEVAQHLEAPHRVSDRARCGPTVLHVEGSGAGMEQPRHGPTLRELLPPELVAVDPRSVREQALLLHQALPAGDTRAAGEK